MKSETEKTGSATSRKTGTESWPSGDVTSPSEKPDFRSARNKRLGRENYEEKARRLLAEGRVNVQRVNRNADVFEATVRGDNDTYEVKWDIAAARWFCPCKAMGICSHIRAVQLVRP